MYSLHQRRRPSAALIVAVIALVVAMGGTGYAALRLPRNSVGTRQIRKNAVVSSKVKNGSLRASDFKAGQLPIGPAGPQGVQGLQGPKGDQGDRGQSGATSIVVRTLGASGGGAFEQVNCLPGERAVAGGVRRDDGFASSSDVMEASYPTVGSEAAPAGATPTGWATAWSSPATHALTFYAVCVAP